MTLLYRLAEWHALAKLRMHTDSTLSILDTITTEVGHVVRRFRDITCASFRTVELPKEAAARGRRQGSAKKGTTALADPAPVQPNQSSDRTSPEMSNPISMPTNSVPPPIVTTPSTQPLKERKVKVFNISTYKLHALGDYVRTIRMFGTTDSYSTQTVSLRTSF
jgi:hypothetical protein